MPTVTILVVLVVAGVALWLVNTYIPMAKPFKTVINVIVCLALVIWLLNLFGLVDLNMGRRYHGQGCNGGWAASPRRK